MKLNFLNKKNKKGQVGSYLPYILFGIVIIIIFAIAAIPIAYMTDEVLDELKEPTNLGRFNTTTDKITQVQGLVTPALDQLIFILLFSIMLGTLFIAMFTDFHPAILAIFIISLILLVIVGGLMGTAYEEVADNDLLTNKSAEFTFTNLVMGSQFPIIILIIGVVGIIIILAKRGNSTSPV
jgi:hypothetical protein